MAWRAAQSRLMNSLLLARWLACVKQKIHSYTKNDRIVASGTQPINSTHRQQLCPSVCIFAYLPMSVVAQIGPKKWEPLSFMQCRIYIFGCPRLDTVMGALPTFRSHIVPLLSFKVYSYSPRIIFNEIVYAVERRVLWIFWLKWTKQKLDHHCVIALQ